MTRIVATAIALLVLCVPTQAHFLELLPNVPGLTADAENRELDLAITFTHPMAGGPVMTMGTPVQVGVLARGEKIDLRDALTPIEKDGKTAYTATYTPARPGIQTFFIEPAPYYEESEGTTIIHYTKVSVDAYGSTGGWRDLVGFPVEIRPLSRQVGLWAGNSFQGQVLHEGEPVPNAFVEIEYYNEGGAVEIPRAPYETQVVLANSEGIFTYTAPRAGWWCFAALVDGPEKMTAPNGSESDVELGGLFWVHFAPME